MCDWEQYGTYYPGKITHAYQDATYKVYYDDGFTEDRVHPEQIRAMTADERKRHKGARSDPACKFQGLVKTVKPQVKALEKKMSQWCISQRAKLGNGKLLAPPPKLTAAIIAPGVGDEEVIEGEGGESEGEGESESSYNSSDRETGTVKWFNVRKGYGFITRDAGDDVFVHFRNIEGTGRRSIEEGRRVSFVVTDGDKGLQADEVSPV